jgi:hypothetical protein
MSTKELKSELQKLDKALLVNLIGELYKKSKEAKAYLDNFLAADDTALFEKCKGKIYEAFFPKRGYKLKLADGKKEISDFRSQGESKIKLAELMLYYAECGSDFTNEYGDIDEPFYNSIAGTYRKALELMKKENVLDQFAERAKDIMNETKNIGWGFHDDLTDAFYEFYEED